MDSILELNGLCKRYDGFYLDHVSLRLPGGCIMGFVGENGAGKSTVIKLILNLIAREAGEVRLFGRDSRKEETALKEDLGVVFDESGFPENFKTGDVDAVLARLYRNWNRKTFRDYLDRFSLPAGKRVKEFSRGMKMKLAIAAALSHRARLLILDEATSGLDPVARDEILDVFLEFIQDEGHSIFVSTHIISDLSRVADYIALLHRGRLLFCEPKDGLGERFGLLRCGAGAFEGLDKSLVAGSRRHEFGVEALVRRTRETEALGLEPAGLEEIVLFSIRGAEK